MTSIKYVLVGIAFLLFGIGFMIMSLLVKSLWGSQFALIVLIFGALGLISGIIVSICAAFLRDDS